MITYVIGCAIGFGVVELVSAESVVSVSAHLPYDITRATRKLPRGISTADSPPSLLPLVVLPCTSPNPCRLPIRTDLCEYDACPTISTEGEHILFHWYGRIPLIVSFLWVPTGELRRNFRDWYLTSRFGTSHNCLTCMSLASS